MYSCFVFCLFVCLFVLLFNLRNCKLSRPTSPAHIEYAQFNYIVHAELQDRLGLAQCKTCLAMAKTGSLRLNMIARILLTLYLVHNCLAVNPGFKTTLTAKGLDYSKLLLACNLTFELATYLKGFVYI